jgi:putative ABC transport system permease protein
MLSVSVVIISSVIIITDTIKSSIRANNSNIDLVVGAKGSSLQLVMSSVYHADVPTGNINYKQVKRFEKHPYVKSFLPISLGDSYKGYRIVGTDKSFTEFYEAKLAKGVNIQNPFDAVIGYKLGNKLKIGDEFVGSHGLIPGGHSHDEFNYKVVGVLAESKSIVDNLIFTPLESIWLAHLKESHHNHKEGENHGHTDSNDHNHNKEEDHKHNKHTNDDKEAENHPNFTDKDLEITSALIQYKSRSAAITFPRVINSQTNFQSASPSYEITKLLKTLGLGSNYINYFAYFICALTILAISVALLKSVSERRKDIALLRVLGAGKFNIFILIIFEALITLIISIITGLLLARILLSLLVNKIDFALIQNIETAKIYNDEIFIVSIILVVSFILAIFSAIKAANSNIIKNLK